MTRRTVLTIAALALAPGLASAAPYGGGVAAPEAGIVAPARQGRQIEKITTDEESMKLVDLVEEQVAKRTGYQKGDLISLGDVDPVLKELVRRGWNAKDIAKVRAKLLPDSELIVREFRTPTGQLFMRQSGRYKMGYDRVDRLAHLSDGPAVLWRITHGPDGYKLIEYMANAPGGVQLANMLSRDPKAGNFNAPTGRIYTAEQLIGELQPYEPK